MGCTARRAHELSAPLPVPDSTITNPGLSPRFATILRCACGKVGGLLGLVGVFGPGCQARHMSCSRPPSKRALHVPPPHHHHDQHPHSHKNVPFGSIFSLHGGIELVDDLRPVRKGPRPELGRRLEGVHPPAPRPRLPLAAELLPQHCDEWFPRRQNVLQCSRRAYVHCFRSVLRARPKVTWGWVSGWVVVGVDPLGPA